MPTDSQDILRRVRRRGLAFLPAGLEAYGTLQGLGVVLAHIGVACLCAAVCTAVFARDALWGGALYPIAAFLIGSRMRALGNVLHETAHGTFFRAKAHNAVLGRLLAIADFQSFETYVREHRTHHARLGVPGEDKDLDARRAFGFDDSRARPFARHILGPLCLHHVPGYLRIRLRVAGEPAPWAALRWAWPCLLLLCLCKISFWGTFLFGVFPYLTWYQVFRYWSDALDHAGLLSAPDAFHRARNHLTPWRALDLLLFPRNDGYHLAHHVLPSVPVRHLREVHAHTLLQDPEYARRDHALGWGDAAFAPAAQARASPDQGSDRAQTRGAVRAASSDP